MPEREEILIIGAGLGGLATAIGLGREGHRVLEARDGPGGLCDTTADEGFRFDRTGHLLHLSRPEVRRLVLGALDEEPLVIGRRARIRSHGVDTPYPFQANLFGLPRPVVEECLLGLLAARAAPPRRRPRTFEEFILAHFGAGIARHFMIPYNTKLWGLHPREISPDWCDRFVPIPSVEEVVRGALGEPQERLGYNASFCYPRRGIGELAGALARRVPRIDYRTRPRAVDWRRRRVLVGHDWRPYRALVSTMPLPELIRILVDAPPRIAGLAASLSTRGLWYLDVALERPAGTDAHWTYVPEPRLPFYRVGCYTHFSPDLAPPGRGSLYVELSAPRRPRLDAIRPRVAAGLVELGLIRRPGDISFARLRRIDYAYVIYDEARRRAVGPIQRFLVEHGIHSIGRYGTFEYAAMEDALAQGLATAALLKAER